MIYLLIPFVIQGVAMFFDEIYFHRKRGLPLWEQIGHPLDSITVLICYLFLYLNEPSDFNLKIYVGLCIFSCLFITKDEFVHSQHCDPLENWLHAILFILHPITFLCAGLMWLNNLNPTFILGQTVIVFAFMLYQIIYWRIYGKSK